MRVLVVDDEPIARRRLMRMLSRIENVEVIGEAGDVTTALQRLRADRPDLVLLDIEMPGRSGLELARSETDLPPIIFTTAYKQYAVEGRKGDKSDFEAPAKSDLSPFLPHGGAAGR